MFCKPVKFQHDLENYKSSNINQESVERRRVHPPYRHYSQGNPSHVIFRPGIQSSRGVYGCLSKPRRREQRELHETKGLMSKTLAVHVRYRYFYSS